MKLFLLCKRRPQGKDLLTRPYGRFYYLPKYLADKKHEVHILLFSYKKEPQTFLQKDGIHWTSLSLLKHGPFAYFREAGKIIEKVKPDWIIGFSDTYYGILAQRLGTKFNIPSLIDAYDNYESYIPWLKPLHALWRSSLSKATLVTVAGPSLVDLLLKSRPNKPTEIIPMAADPTFKPLDKIECRKKLGLPVHKKLIGYSGSTIHESRDIHLLFKAANLVQQELPDTELVLTGRKGRNITIPPSTNWLGYIPDEQMPLLMNSLDVLVVMNKPSSFGNYTYPVKLYEALKCQTSVVVSETLSTQWILRNDQEMLIAPGNTRELSNKIKSILNHSKSSRVEQDGWDAIGGVFEKLLVKYADNASLEINSY